MTRVGGETWWNSTLEALAARAGIGEGATRGRGRNITDVRNVVRADFLRKQDARPSRAEAFLQAAMQDNAAFSRFKASSLHPVAEALRKNELALVVDVAGTIPLEKWRKYPDAKQVLLQLIPAAHRDALETLFGKPIDFASVRMAADAGGFIEHRLAWSSSTGNIQDLNHVRTRERITWVDVDPDVAQYVLPEYRHAGAHYGLGVASGVAGQALDTHQPAGPFGTPAAIPYDGPAISQRLEQMYQYSLDGGATWTDFPGGGYRITRTLRSGPIFELRKESILDPDEAATSTWTT